MAVTPNGLRCQSRDTKVWQGVRGTKGVTGKGKYYYEATVADEGLCRVGYSTPKVRETVKLFMFVLILQYINNNTGKILLQQLILAIKIQAK